VAQHAAYRAKVGYHQAIRRLHAAGGSLREIAEALRMSHQRVHQIIDEAEPTRRREPPRLSGPVGPCSFCGHPHDVCAKLIAGPGVFICDRCVIQATRLTAGPAVDDRAEGAMRLEPPGSEAPVQLLRPGGPEGALPGRQRAVGACRQVRRPAPDLRQVPGRVPGDPGRDLAGLSRARWAAGTALRDYRAELEMPPKVARAAGPPEGADASTATRPRRGIAARQARPTAQAADLQVCAPGRTRTCTLRIRSRPMTVQTVSPGVVLAGQVGWVVQAVRPSHVVSCLAEWPAE
jgi:ClpX C4-type zinc finger